MLGLNQGKIKSQTGGFLASIRRKSVDAYETPWSCLWWLMVFLCPCFNSSLDSSIALWAKEEDVES